MADVELVVIESPLQVDIVTVTPNLTVEVVGIESGVTGGGGGVTDHGLLTGLADDDHTQYHNDARGDVRYYTKSANDALLLAKAPLASPAFTGTPTGITKAHVGLGNVDNTADSAKPVSAATQTALDAKAPLASPTFTGTVAGVTKAHVGLSNVDNTSDTAKPVSSAQQAALDLKAPLASPAFTGTPTGITKSHVGLANVDNTSDASKPVSTAQQTALDLKANLASPAFTGTPTGITKTHVGLGNVDNTADTAKPVSTAQQTALNLKADLSATVQMTGNQTVAGIKTFSSSPVVPDSSFTIAKTTGLQTALDGKAASTHSHAIADLPAGSVLYTATTTRPTARTDVIVMFLSATDPGANAFNDDIWVRT